MEEFLLGNVLDAIVSQVMILLRERNLRLFHEIPEDVKALYLYGDQIRLQLVLSNFLLNVVRFASSPSGWVEITVSPGLKLIQDCNERIRLQFRYPTTTFFTCEYSHCMLKILVAHFSLSQHNPHTHLLDHLMQ